MRRLGLERELVDATVYENTVVRFREAGIGLPTFAQLADPALIPANVRAALKDVGPDDAHPLNLFRVHWYNDSTRRELVAAAWRRGSSPGSSTRRATARSGPPRATTAAAASRSRGSWAAAALPCSRRA